jgi:hypothetical protein
VGLVRFADERARTRVTALGGELPPVHLSLSIKVRQEGIERSGR